MLWLAVSATILEADATFNFLATALEALACGCGCQFYDVGTCETRYTTECEVTLFQI